MIAAELVKLTEQEYGIKCVAGENGLNQVIHYVSVQELPLKSNRFSKNGLVLSTFSSFESCDEIMNHLHWYHSKHVAAVGFHLAVHSTIPEQIKRTASQLNLPLLSIPSHVPYHVLFDIIYKQLHREDHSTVLDVDYINQEILRILIEKEDLLSMLDEIGRLANIRIFVTDPMFKLTSASKLIREQSLDWQRVLDQHLDVTQLDYQQLLAEGRHFSIHRLNPSDGYVFIEEMPSPSVHHHSLLNTIRKSIQLVYKQQNSGHAVENETEFKQALIGKGDDAFKFTNVTLDELVLLRGEDESLRFALILIQQQARLKEKEILHTFLNADLVVAGCRDLFSTNSLEEWNQKNTGMLRAAYVSIDPGQESMLNRSYEKARLVIECTNGKQPSASWHKEGYHSLLNYMENHPVLASIGQEMIRPIVQEDTMQNSDLAHTLLCYLETFFSLTKAAESLYVHPNTVQYRLHKIKQLIPRIDWQQSDTYMAMVIALRLHFTTLVPINKKSIKN